MAQGSLPNQQDMEVDLRRQLNDVFGEFEDFAGLVGRHIFGVIPSPGVMRGLNPYSLNRIPSNAALPSASLCLQEMKNVPPLIPPLLVSRNEIENSGCASEASSSHSHINDDENYHGRKKRKRSGNEDDDQNKRKEKKEENKMMRDLFDDDNEDEGEWRDRGNNIPRQGIRRMILKMQVEPLIPPIEVDRMPKKKEEEEEEREERERRRRKERDELERRKKEKPVEEERKKKKEEEEERRRKRDEEDERKKKKDEEEKRRRTEDDEKRRKREEEEKEREKKRKEAEEKRKRKEDSEREEEERRIRKEQKRIEKEERRNKEEEEKIMKEQEEMERKKKEEDEKRRMEEELRLEKEMREREEMGRRMEEEKKRETERMRHEEEERKKEMERMRKEEEVRRKEEEASKRKNEDERKKKEDEDGRMRKEKKREEEKKRQKTDEKERKKKVDLSSGTKEKDKEKKGFLPLNAISHSKLEVLKEKEKDKRKRERKLSESKEGKSGSLLNEKKKKKEWNDEKGKEKKVKDLDKISKREISSARSSPKSSKNSSRVATPIPPLSLPSTSSHHHEVVAAVSSDISFSYPHCLPSCRAADLAPDSPPPLEQRSDMEGYTNYAKERKHRGDASQDRVLRFLHYMESSLYFALSVSFFHPAKSNDRELTHAGCVLKDTVELIKHGLVLMEKEGNAHLLNRARILCLRFQAVLNYHMYFVRSNKFPRRAETLASLESQVQEVVRESPKKEENGGKKSGEKNSTPSHSSSSSSSNMVTMPISLWKMKTSQVVTYSHLESSHSLWNESIKLMTVHEKHYWNIIDTLILKKYDWGCPLHVGSSLLHLSHFINTAVSWMRLEYEAERH